MPLPDMPSVLVKVPGGVVTQGELDLPPAVQVFPVAGPADTSGLAFIKRIAGAYAPRSTVTNDPLRVVVWIGDVAPAIDATYALDNVDVWWDTGV